MTYRSLFLICLLLADSSRAPAQTPTASTSAHVDKPSAADIDLIAATIYGKPLFELSLDQLTDLLGRPTSIREPTVDYRKNAKLGTALAYLNKGLLVGCEHPDVDPRQTVKVVQVYLSRSRPVSGISFSQFPGTLSYGLNGNWKAARVMEAFTQFNPEDKSDSEMARALKGINEITKQTEQLMREMDGKPPQRKEDNPLARITLKTPNANIEFSYEENTKFIDWVLISH